MRGSSTVPLVGPALVLALVASTGALPVILPSHGPSVTVIHALEGASYVPADPARVFIVTDERSKSQDGSTVPNLEEHASKYGQLFTDAHLHAERDKPVESDWGGSGEVVIFSNPTNPADLSSRFAPEAHGAAGDCVVHEEPLAGDYSSPRSASIYGHTGVTVYEGGSVTQRLLGEQSMDRKSNEAVVVELDKPDRFFKGLHVPQAADSEADLKEKFRNTIQMSGAIMGNWESSLAQPGDVDTLSFTRRGADSEDVHHSKEAPFAKRMQNLLRAIERGFDKMKKERIESSELFFEKLNSLAKSPSLTPEQRGHMKVFVQFAEMTVSDQKEAPAYPWDPSVSGIELSEVKKRAIAFVDKFRTYLQDNAESLPSIGINSQEVLAKVDEEMKRAREELEKTLKKAMQTAASSSSTSSSDARMLEEALAIRHAEILLTQAFSRLKTNP